MKKLMPIWLVTFLVILGLTLPSLAQGKVVLEVWNKYNPGEPMEEWFRTVTAEFEKAHPDIKVDLQSRGRQVIALAQPRLIEGNPPDILETHSPTVYRLASEGLLVSLDEAMASSAYGKDVAWKDTFLDLVHERGKMNGHSYHAPLFYTTAGFFYNMNLFEELGLAVPDTWDEFIAVCQALQAGGYDAIAVDVNSDYFGWWFMLTSTRLLGSQYVQDTFLNKEGTSWKDPGYLEAAKLVEELSRNCFMKGFQGSQWPAAQIDWVNGLAGMLYCGSWLPNEMGKQMPEDFRTDLFRFPAIPGGKGDQTALEVWDNGLIIPKGAKHPEEAIKYMKFVTSREMANLMPSMTLSPIKGTNVHEFQKSAPELIESANSLIDLRNGTTTLAPEWEVTVFQPLNDKFLLGELDATQFIEKLQEQHERYYERKK